MNFLFIIFHSLAQCLAYEGKVFNIIPPQIAIVWKQNVVLSSFWEAEVSQILLCDLSTLFCPELDFVSWIPDPKLAVQCYLNALGRVTGRAWMASWCPILLIFFWPALTSVAQLDPILNPGPAVRSVTFTLSLNLPQTPFTNLLAEGKMRQCPVKVSSLLAVIDHSQNWNEIRYRVRESN